MSNALFPTLHSFIQLSKESKLDSTQTFAENTQKDMADVKSKSPLNMSKMSTAKTKKSNVSPQTRTALPPLPNGIDKEKENERANCEAEAEEQRVLRQKTGSNEAGQGRRLREEADQIDDKERVQSIAVHR